MPQKRDVLELLSPGGARSIELLVPAALLPALGMTAEVDDCRAVVELWNGVARRR